LIPVIPREKTHGKASFWLAQVTILRYHKAMKSCHACEKPLPLGRSVGRKEACSFCGADLYCCINCKFYAPSVSKQCREPAAELIKEKTKANFCDYFIFADFRNGERPDSAAKQTRQALDDLFKK